MGMEPNKLCMNTRAKTQYELSELELTNLGLQQQIKELEYENSKVLSSVRFKIGSLMVDIIKRPWKVFTVPFKIFRLVRSSRRKRTYKITPEEHIKSNKICCVTDNTEHHPLIHEVIHKFLSMGLLDLYTKSLDNIQCFDKYKKFIRLYNSEEALSEIAGQYKLYLSSYENSEDKDLITKALGCGTCVMSLDTKATDQSIKNLIADFKNEEEAVIQAHAIFFDPDYRSKLTARGYTEINKLQYNQNPSNKIKRISVVAVTMRPQYMKKVFDDFVKQSYPHKELIIVVNNDAADIEKYEEEKAKYPNEDITILQTPASIPLGKCLNIAFDKAKYEYLLKVDDDDYYTENYIEDELIYFDTTQADIIGKNTFYVYFEGSERLGLRFPDKENQYTDLIAGSAMIFRKELFNKIRFDDELNVSEIAAFLKAARSSGYKVYSTHRYNHAVVRRGDLNSHTWRESEEEYITKCKMICDNIDYKTLDKIVHINNY